MKSIYWLLTITVFVSLFLPAHGFAMTPQELQDVLTSKQRITIIDLRNNKLYRQSHIPGAINVPAPVVSVKRLPPFGQVVAYGDGVRTDVTLGAIDDLNEKNGINAVILEGGFGAWQSSKMTTTEKAGLSNKGWHFMTYKELKKSSSANPEMVLLDLRKSVEQPLVDLSQEFPLQRTLKLAQKKKRWDISPCTGANIRNKLFVIIDNGTEEHLKVARQLNSAGIKRVAILTGGEIALSRKGATSRKTVVTTTSAQ